VWYWIKILFLVFVGSVILWLAYELVTFPSVSKLKNENPTTTSMIEHRISQAVAEGREPRKFMMWVPMEQISPHLQRAVLAGEDSRFFVHDGFDWEAIESAWNQAIKDGEREAREECEAAAKAANTSAKDCRVTEDDWIPPLPSFSRGASTITQQLAKNLYLSEDRNFLRKGREAAYTYFLERNLSKKRILEIYLNVIEWGDGVYGAEAASRNYFRKSAADLTREDAAYLAAMIPSPLNVFNPAKNRKRVLRRQRVILRGMGSVKLDYQAK
jgi:monofunctional glycosyltransferase